MSSSWNAGTLILPLFLSLFFSVYALPAEAKDRPSIAAVVWQCFQVASTLVLEAREDPAFVPNPLV